MSKGAKVGIVAGAVILSIVILVLMVYALKLRKRVLRAEKLNKPFGKLLCRGFSLLWCICVRKPKPLIV